MCSVSSLVNTQKSAGGEVPQRLGAFAALGEDRSSVPSTTQWFTTTGNSSSWDSAPSSGLYGHCTHVHKHTKTHRCTQSKIIKSKSFFKKCAGVHVTSKKAVLQDRVQEQHRNPSQSTEPTGRRAPQQADQCRAPPHELRAEDPPSPGALRVAAG